MNNCGVTVVYLQAAISQTQTDDTNSRMSELLCCKFNIQLPL